MSILVVTMHGIHNTCQQHCFWPTCKCSTARWGFCTVVLHYYSTNSTVRDINTHVQIRLLRYMHEGRYQEHVWLLCDFGSIMCWSDLLMKTTLRGAPYKLSRIPVKQLYPCRLKSWGIHKHPWVLIILQCTISIVLSTHGYLPLTLIISELPMFFLWIIEGRRLYIDRAFMVYYGRLSIISWQVSKLL